MKNKMWIKQKVLAFKLDYALFFAIKLPECKYIYFWSRINYVYWFIAFAYAIEQVNDMIETVEFYKGVGLNYSWPSVKQTTTFYHNYRNHIALTYHPKYVNINCLFAYWILGISKIFQYKEISICKKIISAYSWLYIMGCGPGSNPSVRGIFCHCMVP